MERASRLRQRMVGRSRLPSSFAKTEQFDELEHPGRSRDGRATNSQKALRVPRSGLPRTYGTADDQAPVPPLSKPSLKMEAASMFRKLMCPVSSYIPITTVSFLSFTLTS